MPRLIPQNNVEGTPESSAEANQSKSEAQDGTQRNHVPKSLCLQEPWECITLHGLEHIVLGRVKHFGVISAVILNQVDNRGNHGFWQHNLSLGTGKQICVQDFLSAGANVIAGHCVPGGGVVKPGIRGVTATVIGRGLVR